MGDTKLQKGIASVLDDLKTINPRELAELVKKAVDWVAEDVAQKAAAAAAAAATSTPTATVVEQTGTVGEQQQTGATGVATESTGATATETKTQLHAATETQQTASNVARSMGTTGFTGGEQMQLGDQMNADVPMSRAQRALFTGNDMFTADEMTNLGDN